ITKLSAPIIETGVHLSEVGEDFLEMRGGPRFWFRRVFRLYDEPGANLIMHRSSPDRGVAHYCLLLSLQFRREHSGVSENSEQRRWRQRPKRLQEAIRPVVNPQKQVRPQPLLRKRQSPQRTPKAKPTEPARVRCRAYRPVDSPRDSMRICRSPLASSGLDFEPLLPGVEG